jgi:hypothetical protein
MAAPYLDELEQAFLAGAKDLNTAADMCGIDFESACLSFNNGLLKGYWKIVVNDPALVCKHCGLGIEQNEQGFFRYRHTNGSKYSLCAFATNDKTGRFYDLNLGFLEAEPRQ